MSARPGIRHVFRSATAGSSRSAQLPVRGLRRAHTPSNAARPPNPRWLSELQNRLGNCSTQATKPGQAQKVRELTDYVQANWRELVAGREGYLAATDSRGLKHHAVAWGDMDAMVSHVNNVIYNRYAESARVNWVTGYAAAAEDPDQAREWATLMTPRGLGLILRSIKTDYKFPLTYPDRVTVLHKLVAKPEDDSDHILLEAVILSERYQRPAARCFEDIVVFDYTAGKKAPMKGFMVEAMQKTWEEQLATKEKCDQMAESLLKSVEELEASV